MTELRVYDKHDSFAGIRVSADEALIRRRLEGLLGRLDTLDLSAPEGAIVRQACLEATGGVSNQPQFVLQPYALAEMARLTDEQLPRYLVYRYRYETFPAKRELDTFPPCLQIEPTSICNYRCVFCFQIDGELTKRENGHMGVMALDTFRQVIDQAQGQCEAITLASRGEPLMAPGFVDMVTYTAGKFLALKINTNAWYLDEARAHAILASDVSTLVFSADAASEPTYSKFRVRGNLERVMGNIERFQEIRLKQYPKARTLTRVSGVKVPGTPGLDEMEAAWGSLVDQVAFVEYNPWEAVYDRPTHDLATPCSDLWRRMFVWWDGRVNPCDIDYRSTLSVGRVSEASLSEIWQADAYNDLRRRHLEGQRPGCHPCNRCVLV